MFPSDCDVSSHVLCHVYFTKVYKNKYIKHYVYAKVWVSNGMDEPVSEGTV